MTPTEDVQRRLALVKLEAKGVLDKLPCPSCGQAAVSVRYTNPSLGQYRTWFICQRCGFSMRVQNSGVPEHFSQSRVDTRLEESDRE